MILLYIVICNDTVRDLYRYDECNNIYAQCAAAEKCELARLRNENIVTYIYIVYIVHRAVIKIV